MRLVFILILFATTAQAQFVINPYAFAGAGAAVLNAYANEKSIDLDGTAEYVSVDDADNLSFGDASTDSPFSISAWMYFSGDNSDDYGLMGKGSDPVREWHSWYENFYSGWVFVLYDNTSANYIRANATNINGILLDNDWHHIACTYDGSSSQTGMEIYIDGVLKTNQQLTGGTYVAMHNQAEDLNIGNPIIGQNTQLHFGKMDQVAIWDTVLSIDEIKEAMAIRDYNYHSRAANLVSWWDFDNDTTTTDGITDLIGTNHGTMQSGEYADLNTHVTWPYSYQLDSNAVWDSITPMQYAFTDSIHGGFSWLLDGSNEYISFGDIDAFSFTDGAGTDEPFSVCAWTKWETDNVMWHVSKDDDVNNIREWTLYRSATLDAFSLRLDDGTDNHRIVSYSNAHELNKWLHVCATYNGGEDTSDIEIYVNGVEDKASNGAAGTYTGMSNTATEFAIGREDGGLYYTDGNISDVIIFDRVITAAEVAAVYNNHEPRDETKYDLSANIIGYWRGYNSTNTASGVLDQSGNGNNGTPTNTDNADFAYDYPREVLDSTGSFEFDGSDEYISVPDDNSLSFGDGATDSPFSLSISFNVSSLASQEFFYKIRSNNTEYEYHLNSNGSSQLFFRLFDNNASNSISIISGGLGTTYNNTFTNVVCTYDGSGNNSGLKMYINGVLTSTTPSAAGSYVAMENNTGELWISTNGTISNYGSGKRAHASVIGKELSLAEIQELYNDGSPVDITKVTFAANVVSHWRLDQTDDPTGTVTDIVGSNNGTATNMEAGDLKTDTYPTN